jgi:hypothetical protein
MYDNRNSSAFTGKEGKAGGEPPAWSWDALIPHLIHPIKVHVLEALLWIGEPLSAADLEKVFDGDPQHGLISYHIKCLSNPGILECVGTRQVRGAHERYFSLAAKR